MPRAAGLPGSDEGCLSRNPDKAPFGHKHLLIAGISQTRFRKLRPLAHPGKNLRNKVLVRIAGSGPWHELSVSMRLHAGLFLGRHPVQRFRFLPEKPG